MAGTAPALMVMVPRRPLAAVPPLGGPNGGGAPLVVQTVWGGLATAGGLSWASTRAMARAAATHSMAFDTVWMLPGNVLIFITSRSFLRCCANPSRALM